MGDMQTTVSMPIYPQPELTLEHERALAFLAAYPHASLLEIAAHSSRSAAAALEALTFLLVRGYVKRSARRFVGWVAVPWMFNPDGDPQLWPQERGPVVDMAD